MDDFDYDFDDLDDFFVCPNCYADVPWNAAACPECGSDEETGWAEETETDIYYEDNESEEKPKAPLWQKIVLIFLAYLLASPLSAFFEPSSTGFLLLTILLVIAIVYLVVAERLGADVSLATKTSRTAKAMSDYDSLMMRARHDQSLVERLIAFEQSRNPEGDRERWISDALLRWKRDSRS